MAITQDQVLTFLGGGLVVFVLEKVFQHLSREKRALFDRYGLNPWKLDLTKYAFHMLPAITKGTK